LFFSAAAIALHVMLDSSPNPAAVLFDRDGTLVADVPYNDDPTTVVPMPTVQLALAALRRRGLRTGVVTNQSGIGRGALSWDQVTRVNERVEDLLGPFDVWRVCPHMPADGCACRKPAPGMVRSAATALGLPPSLIAVVGDIGSDVAAALAAGARAVLVPTPTTRPEEVAVAPAVAPTLLAAVELLLEADQLKFAS
jgi:D-glycero-D-manno-heptose 1,7-bisphosphate phosphatase